ncbi:NAD(P)-dependent oxidoreductase [Halobaculum sp. MBLA0147]|uniref:NAD(P)-dependent oxidoreductase n=1 Tax=Halobaculum sp. MBLA0147 TaxID=3079934 RepID=UPI003524DBAC
MRITVFGASGRTGIPLVRAAVADGHEVVAFVRTAEKLTRTPPDGGARIDADDPNLEIVEGDAYTGEGVVEAVRGADAVVSVLGQTSGSPDDLLTVAGDHVLDAMRETGVRRFVGLVGAGVREPGESVSLPGRAMGVLLRLAAGSVLADAETHVQRVEETNLDWTVARVPRLTDDPGTGEYRAGDVTLGFEAVSRADVAQMLLDTVVDEAYVRELPKVGPA